MTRSDKATFIAGIDLGTTNSALGFIEAGELSSDKPVSAAVLDIAQLASPGQVLPRPMLPSFMYIAEAGEFSPGQLDLPWAKERAFMVGAGAHERGAEVPLRMVGSAKSWLSHGGVDRRAAILPHQAPEGVKRVSPVLASTRYLEHIRDAWNAAHGDASLEEQEVLLTVPASFDAVARDLTLEAAREAGLHDVTLLEEPQAAFYAWLAKMGDAWRKMLRVGDRILVCDVGGGTTDFSLIEVKEDAGNLALERIAVGDHILLGGDNMDLLLAHHLTQRLAEDGKKLDASQQRALVIAARRAKEQLLTDLSLESAPVTILGRGSKLIGGKIKADLLRSDVERLLVEGFFPRAPRDAKPERAKRTGFMELGLPFVSDTGITRHLAHFLATHDRGRGTPTHVLFNGGVFNSALLRARLVETMASWSDRAPKVLEGADYDLAVARGAAYYGAVRRGRGIRIRGGTARSYYIGIETSAPAVPGVAPPIRALCIVPFGMEEGTDARVPGGELGLVVGEPVEFRFLESTTRKNDRIGQVLDEYTWPGELIETAPISSMMEADEVEPGTLVPVRLEVKLTEIGTLEVWSVSSDGRRRWRLEFNVREKEAPAS
jgi:molecular chaperone DnaK (HSP70)